MLSIFLGPDDYSKRQKVAALAEKAKATVVFYQAPELPLVEELLAQDLFGSRKIFVLVDGLALLAEQKEPGGFINSENHIIILQEKADKRLNSVKKLLADKAVKVEEFTLPHGKEFDKWLMKHIGERGAKIEPEALELLAKRLGRDEAKEIKFGGKVVATEEVFNLWQADAEIKKLVALAGDDVITPEMVGELVPETAEADVLDIVNAIAEKDKPRLCHLIDKFLLQVTSSDEKAKIIQLNALLSEQFRNVAAVQDFLSRRVSEAKILELTNWKSGRLFILKRIAGRFSARNVLDLLNKLSLLDGELKSSQTPPRVLLDLITAQLLA